MWKNMLNGVSGAAEITRFDHKLFKTHFACEIKDFDPSAVFNNKEARKYDRYAQYAIAAAKEAMHDAAFDTSAEDPYRLGVIWSSGVGGIDTYENELLNMVANNGVPNISPFFITKYIPNMAAGHISIMFNLKGINYSINSACASSAHAVSEAFIHIRENRADMIVTGGSEAPITRMGVGGFNAMRALSTYNDTPQTASRPFSASRNGFVIGEGAGCLILEEYEHAVRRGAKIYAELAGIGMNADAYHITAPQPEGEGAYHVMADAIKQAGITIEQINYINAHGTSTPRGDIAEAKAIKALFGQHADRINISSTKSMTGHLLGATAAVEAITCVLAMRDNIAPPTINHADGDNDPEIDYSLNFTFNHAQHCNIDYAISNSFGFGGHNACLVFKKCK